MSHQHTSQRSLFESGPQWAEDDARQGIIATVVLPDGIEKPLDYLVPEPLAASVEPGRRVLVPLGRGNRERLAYCVAVRSGELPQTPLKSVAGVEDDAPLLSRRMLDLTQWMADRWMARWGEVLEAVLPAGVRFRRKSRAVPLLVTAGGEPPRKPTPAQKRVLAAATTPTTADALAESTGASRAVIMRLFKAGLLRESGSVDRPHGLRSADAVGRPPISHDRPAELAPAQAAALEAILDPLRAGRHQTVVLFGVTGSGKTEVYLQAVEETLSYGRQAIVLVPEISLTPQTCDRFRARFGSVAVMHSQLTPADRHAQWRDRAAIPRPRRRGVDRTGGARAARARLGNPGARDLPSLPRRGLADVPASVPRGRFTTAPRALGRSPRSGQPVPRRGHATPGRRHPLGARRGRAGDASAQPSRLRDGRAVPGLWPHHAGPAM